MKNQKSYGAFPETLRILKEFHHKFFQLQGSWAQLLEQFETKAYLPTEVLVPVMITSSAQVALGPKPQFLPQSGLQ